MHDDSVKTKHEILSTVFVKVALAQLVRGVICALYVLESFGVWYG